MLPDKDTLPPGETKKLKRDSDRQHGKDARRYRHENKLIAGNGVRIHSERPIRRDHYVPILSRIKTRTIAKEQADKR